MLFKNTLAQSSTLVSGQIFSVILAPLMLGRFGLAAFGVWAVTGALATYAGLLDFGITRAMSRYVAFYHAQGDRQAITESIGLGLLAVTVVGALAAGVALLAAPLLTSELGVFDLAEMRILVLSSVAIFVSTAYSRVLAAIPIGMQRMIPPNVASVSGNVLNFAASVAAIALSPELTDYAMANAAAEAFRIPLALASVFVVWSGSIAALPGLARAREILSYGFKSQLDFISQLVNFQTDKVIIAFLLGPSQAAVYELAARVVLAARAVGVLTLSALVPTATAQLVARGREAIPAFYRRYTLLSLSLAFPLYALSCIGAPFLFVAWLGAVPGNAVAVVVGLTVGSFVNITSGVASSIILASGRAGMVARVAILSTVANVVLTLALAPLFELWGVLAGTVIALAGSSLVLVRNYHRAFEIPGREYARAVLPPAALALGLAVPFAVFDVVIDAGSQERWTALALLVGVSGLYGLAYWLLASRLRFLPDRLTAPWSRRRPQAAPAVDSARAGA